MVNEKPITKRIILEMLRASSVPVAGDVIAKEIGISRVAVWKAIQSLESYGYKIDSARNGYLLTEDLNDSLFPWEFETAGTSFMHFKEIDSTMIQARMEAEKKSFAGKLKVITADRQKKGKGHGNHGWKTTKGSLACTMVLKESIPIAESHRLVMACQIASAKVLQENEKKIFLRWPNDIWTENGKAGGVLDDVSATGSLTNWVNLGLGINLFSKPRLEGTDCIISGAKGIQRKDVLEKIIDGLKDEIAVAKINDSSLERQWNSFCPDIGKKIRVKDSSAACIFKGINAYGWAILEINGQENIFPPGTISFQKIGG